MTLRTRSWLGVLVLGLIGLVCTGILTAVAIAGAAVGPPTAGSRR